MVRQKAPGSRELWTCATCGRSFANTGQWHACTDVTVDEHLEGRSPEIVGLYRAFEALVADAGGEFRRHPARTRIAFIGRMSFAGATFGRDWIDVHMILPWWHDDDRFSHVNLYSGDAWEHRLRVRDASELDDDVARWAALAWRRGRQEAGLVAPARERAVPILSRRTADRFQCTFRGKVHEDDGVGDGLVALPGYLLDAIGDMDTPLRIRAKGVTWDGGLVEHRTAGWCVALAATAGGGLDPESGLPDPGAHCDITIRPLV